MTIIEQVKQVLDSGDPEVREWFLIRGYFWPPALCLLYVLMVKKIGPALMKGRKPFELRNIMIFYNFFVVSVYVFSILSMPYYMAKFDFYNHICSKSIVMKGGYIYKMTSLGYAMYLVKYLEFLDTVFFILRKKDHLITNLHVVHHASLPIIAWLIFRIETSGAQFFPGVLNGIVHIIMYTYYGFAAMGPGVRKYLWWKKYLTIFQMAQFIIIFVFMTVFVPLSGCESSKLGVQVDIIFAVLFFAMFYNFYTKTYRKSKTIAVDGDVVDAAVTKSNGCPNGVVAHATVSKANGCSNRVVAHATVSKANGHTKGFVSHETEPKPKSN